MPYIHEQFRYLEAVRHELTWKTRGAFQFYDAMTRKNLSAWRCLWVARNHADKQMRWRFLEGLKERIGNKLDQMPSLMPAGALAEMAMCHP
jgi:hypothetical protein